MLIIREEQWEVLTEYSRKSGEDRFVKSFFQRYPDECGQMGEEALRRRVHRGMKKGKIYGLTMAAHVEQFIDMMFAWGDNFDTSPKLPWATRALSANADADVRLRQLAINASAAQEAEFKRKLKRKQG